MRSRLINTLVFTLIAPGLVAGGIPALIIWASGARPAEAPWLAAGAVVLVAGLTAFVWCVADFVTLGRGTPDPNRPPTELVASGLFSVVRNPMYAALLTVVGGEALLFASPWLTAWGCLLFAAFHARVVMNEEPTLARTFGASWESYRERVRRWLPRVPGGG